MRLIFNGEFSEEELKRFAIVLREIERKNPIEKYFMFIDDQNLSLEKAREIVKRVYEATL